jgi:ELWxxDGT repeat protein
MMTRSPALACSLTLVAVLLGPAGLLRSAAQAQPFDLPVRLVKVIVPGAGSLDVNGVLFFLANDGSHGYELWRSDGTPAGTVLVKDINPGAASSLPAFFADVDGTLFFIATTPAMGFELWKSDGTAAGTVLVKDIYGGIGGSLLSSLTDVNGRLFFAANDGLSGMELWRSDGTDAGTQRVKDLNPGATGSFASSLVSVNGRLFFVATDGTTGYGLWMVPRADYDFDGDGKADLGVFRQSTGEWLVFGSSTGFPGPIPFGAPGLGDIPVPADFDRDGSRADFAVFRASTGEWLIFGSTSGFPGPIPFGAPGLGDLPLNHPAALR